jgi:hypothetical protein
VAAFSANHDGAGEALVVVAELRSEKPPPDELGAVVAAVRGAVQAGHGVPCRTVVLGATSLVPKTTSGKVRRRASRQAFLDGTAQRHPAHRRTAIVPARRSIDAQARAQRARDDARERRRSQDHDDAFSLDRKVVRWSERLPKPWRTLWHLVRGVVGTSILLFVFLPAIGAVLAGYVARARWAAAKRRAAGRPVRTEGGQGFWSRRHLGHIARLGISELCLGQLLVDEERRGLVWRARQAVSEVATVLLYLPFAQRPIDLFDELRAAYGGEWFPFGDGVTVASHASVAAWLSRRDVLKRGQSLGWPSSDSQVGYSGMAPIFLSSAPDTADSETWATAKQLVIRWLGEAWSAVPPRGASADELFRGRPWLPGLLRLVPRHASGMPDRDVVWRAYGEAQFYLLTHGGQLSRDERRAYLDLVANPAPFFSNFVNFLVGGSALERKGLASFDTMRAALYRDRESPPLKAMLGEARRMGVTQNELLRLFTIIVGIAGGPAPPKLAHAVITRLYGDPARMVPLWRKHPRRFLLECARLDKLVPIISINTNDRITVQLPVPDVFETRFDETGAGGAAGKGSSRLRTFEITPDVPIRLCYATANYDPAVFPDPERFDPSRPNLDDLVSWNSPAASAAHHAADGAPNASASGCPHAHAPARRSDAHGPVAAFTAPGDAAARDPGSLLPALPVEFAPRYCAGRDWSLDLIEFLVERFLPAIEDERSREPSSTVAARSADALLNRPSCGPFDYPTKLHVPPRDASADARADPRAAEALRAQGLRAELDSYTRAVLRLMRLAVPRWNAFAPRGIDLVRPADVDLWNPQAKRDGRKGGPLVRAPGALADAGVPPRNELLARAAKPGAELVFGRVLVPSWDEDLPEGHPLARRMARRWVNSSWVSGEELRDLYFPYPRMDEALGWKRAVFGAGLPAGRQAFEELGSDRMTTQLAFAGPACHLTKRLPRADEDADPSVSLVAIQHAPPGAVFANDASELHAFPVRAPYERYGAIAYFDAEYRPLGVWWCHGARFVPASCASAADQAAWSYAKYVWRASWFAEVTVVDHLVNCHLVAGNALTVASRVHLPAEHPLRIFLKPFTFHTASINFQAARSLVNPRGLFDRIWAFEHETLEDIVEHVLSTRLRGGPGGFANDHNFASWRRSSCHPSMRDVPDSVFPLRRDLEEFWATVRSYVAGFFALSYAPLAEPPDGGDASSRPAPAALPLIHVDPELHAFFRALSASLGVPFAGGWTEAVDLVTHAIVTVSAWHMHTGIMVDYVQRPDWIGCKLQGRSLENVQTWTQLLALISVAGVKMPCILDDFSHLWHDADDPRHASMRRLAASFREQLQQLDAAILERNVHRRHPLWTMAPQFVDCSVGS